MSTQRYIQREIHSPCGKCGQDAIESIVEILPKNGKLYKGIHIDGTEHRWAEFSSTSAGEERKVTPKKIIVCPKCGKRGRVNTYRPDRLRHPENIEYQVVHGRIKGTWGKAKSVKRRERCYIRDPEHREAILKKLGRFIQK